MTRLLRRCFVLVLTAVALVGCNFNLDEATLVQTPRILAIVADHPEAAPGQDVHVRVMAYDPMHRELHYTFRACVDSSTFLGSDPSNGTGGMMASMGLCTPWSDPSTSEEGTISGAFSQQLVTLIGTIPRSSGFDPALLTRVLATAGLPITIEVHLSVTNPEGTEAILVSATKLVGITTRDHPTTNPPYIYFRVITQPPVQSPDDAPVEVAYIGGIDPAHPFDCVPWFSAPVTAIASVPGAITDPPDSSTVNGQCRLAPCPNRITLSPADDPSIWEESFPIYDFSGTVRTGYEGSYYSWYSTGSIVDAHGRVHSSLHTETTQGPSHGADPSPADATLRDDTLDVPSDPGDYDMWLVVRDGHLGTNACHFTLHVTAAP